MDPNPLDPAYSRRTRKLGLCECCMAPPDPNRALGFQYPAVPWVGSQLTLNCPSREAGPDRHFGEGWRGGELLWCNSHTR